MPTDTVPAADVLADVHARMSEKEWQAQVVKAAKACGWLIYHTWNSANSAAGFPDLVLVRDDRILFVELKTVKGKVSLAQQEWLTILEATGKVETAVWRPNQWDEVERSLR